MSNVFEFEKLNTPIHQKYSDLYQLKMRNKKSGLNITNQNSIAQIVRPE